MPCTQNHSALPFVNSFRKAIRAAINTGRQALQTPNLGPLPRSRSGVAKRGGDAALSAKLTIPPQRRPANRCRAATIAMIAPISRMAALCYEYQHRHLELTWLAPWAW